MKIFGDRKNKLLFAELLTDNKEHQKTSDNKLQQITTNYSKVHYGIYGSQSDNSSKKKATAG